MSIIKTPKRYISPFLREGEDIVVHILQKDALINLTFIETPDKDCKFQSFIEIDSDTNLLKKSEIKERLDNIETKILSIGGLYTSYAYLFTIKNKELCLMSISLENKGFGFSIVEEIGKELEIKTTSPAWQGVYAPLKIAAFVEDVFIQRQ